MTALADLTLEQVEQLRLQPGDVLALRADRVLSQAERALAQDALSHLIERAGLAGRVQGIVIDKGWRFQVVRTDATA